MRLSRYDVNCIGYTRLSITYLHSLAAMSLLVKASLPFHFEDRHGEGLLNRYHEDILGCHVVRYLSCGYRYVKQMCHSQMSANRL